MSKYIVDSVSKGTITYFMIRDTSDNSIVPLPTKFLRHKKNLGCTKKTIKNLGLKVAWYMNYLHDLDLDFNKVLALSYFEQQEHFSNYLHFVRAGRHTTSGKCPNNNTANEYLRAIFDLYDFIILEYDNGSALKVLNDASFTYTNAVGLRYTKATQTFSGYLPKEEHHGESISDEDLKTLFDSCISLRDKLFLLLLKDTGLRIGELLGIKYTTDIDYETKQLIVKSRTTNENNATAKYCEERSAKIGDSTFDLLLIYLADNSELLKNTEYLFVSEQGPTKGKPLSMSGANAIFERLEERTGFKGHAHMLRHYFANARRKAGWDISMISQAMGHKNISTTEEYMNIGESELVAATEDLFANSLDLVDINAFL